MNKSSVLVQALPIIARAIGSNMGVRVEVDAGRARTDGKVIYLPALPVSDPGVETLALGMTIHESGHIRYGDFTPAFFEAFNKLIPLAMALHGAMEDARMELAVIRDYPGAKVRLEGMVAKLVCDGFFSPVTADAHPAAILQGYVLYFLRSYVLGQTVLTAYADNAHNLLIKLVTPLAMTRINSVIARVSSIRKELDVLTLAQELALVLEEEIKRETPQQDPSQDNDDSSESDESESSDKAANQEVDENGGEPKGDTPSNSDTQDDGQNDSSDEYGQPQGGSSDSTESSEDGGNQDSSSENDGMSQDEIDQAKQAMKDMLDSEDDSSTGDLSEAFASLIEEEVNEAVSERGNYPVSSAATLISTQFTPSDHQEALDKAQAATSALRTRMTRLVQSHAKAHRKTSRHGRRLNDRKINRIAVGNPSVFKSVSKKKAVNTAVQILTDVSGSMSGIIELAMQSALSTTAALKAIPHLSVGSAVFPGYMESAVTVMTDHDQSVQQMAGYYPVARAHGSTPLLPALVWSGSTLKDRKETRRILIVITDGEPDGQKDCEDMINILRKGGIEVYGLGLGVAQQTMSSLFGADSSEVINGVSELAQATFSMLENTLYKAA